MATKKMIRKPQTDYTILVLGFILVLALLVASCGPVKSSHCAYSKGLLHNQGSPQKAFKF